MNRSAWEGFRAFRQQVYALSGCRRDALFEALDAVLATELISISKPITASPSSHLIHALANEPCPKGADPRAVAVSSAKRLE